MKNTADLKIGLKMYSETENSLLIDVRSEGEYADGHVGGSLNIPLDKLPKAVMDGELPKEKTLFVYCRSGARSSQAVSQLKRMGYTSVVNIGGILDYTGEIERG